ncbi:UNVERIFIED_CONTAM: hypothetical protein K2H54_007993 [Gekko kuhli]
MAHEASCPIIPTILIQEPSFVLQRDGQQLIEAGCSKDMGIIHAIQELVHAVCKDVLVISGGLNVQAVEVVSVLTDQVEAQGEKIRDLEFCLEEHREKLNATEEMLQQELLSRTSLETQKLDLMAEVSNLKLKLTSVEKDRKDYENRFRDTELVRSSQKVEDEGLDSFKSKVANVHQIHPFLSCLQTKVWENL